MKKKVSLKDRLQYWFDNRMSNGSLGLIRVLLIATGIAVVVIAIGLSITENEYEGFFAPLWDSIASVINTEMPYSGDGGAGYIIFISIAAVFGLLLTSVLIGIIANAIEEKISNLKRGNSLVVEENHIIILGFTPGEYSLINQLILAAAGEKESIVVACELERNETEQYIHDNLEIPKNVKIICRAVDIFNPKDIERCAIATCRSVIINPMDDHSTAKVLLAVSTALNGIENEKIHVAAIVEKQEYIFPDSVAKRHNVVAMHIEESIARIIAHSCTQQGLSQTFTEVFNFEGNELYVIDVPETVGLEFNEVLNRFKNSVPVGIFREEKQILVPNYNELIHKNDKLIVFAENQNAAEFGDNNVIRKQNIIKRENKLPQNSVLIIGSNDVIDIVLAELPEDVTKVKINHLNEKHRKYVESALNKRADLEIEIIDEIIPVNGNAPEFIKEAKHIVVLNDHDEDDEIADMNNIFCVINLRDIRRRFKLDYNITVELQCERNQRLVQINDGVDFVVSSSLSSLLLAQLSESPELYEIFNELLSNEGCELFMKNPEALQCAGEKTVAEIRDILLRQGYIFIGFLPEKTNVSVFNPEPNKKISLQQKDRLIVLGEE